MPYFLCLIFLLLSPAAFAAEVPHFSVVPEKSTLAFVAMQNGAPVKGEFKRFTADIAFDPAQLDKSSVTVEVEVASVASSNTDMQSSLPKAEWFDAGKFPKAIFKTKTISLTPGTKNEYYADGELTLRDKTLPLQVAFKLEKYDAAEAIATGKATILRTQFGVGQGEWKKTDAVGDPVSVNFRVVAQRHP